MKPIGKALARISGAALLLATAVATQAQETGGGVSGRYTAQGRPRVAVFKFEDTNTEAANARYGSSVAAMLATFLDRESQLAVVERQTLGPLYEEKQRIQRGLVAISPGDTAARELLEKIDAFIVGDVTLLDGSRIEVDAKLFSGFDGRVVASAQRSGPKTCLRSIVERLGIALEQEFLRPYFGKLKINLTDPENVRIFLTPIPLDITPDEEKQQVERGSTIKIGGEYDTVESWMTDPTGYTVEGLLAGWYSLRLERPGYEDLKTDKTRWEARERSGRREVYDRLAGRPLGDTGPELRRFVVRVDSLATGVIDGEALRFVFRKKGGSLAPRVKRKYLDTDFSQSPQRVILMGKGLDLNKKAAELDEDRQCDLLRGQPRLLPDHGRTFIASGQTFDFGKFKGGELIIEDYKGETVPAGLYQLALWEPNYQVKKIDATVSDRDLEKVTRTDLDRETLPLKLDLTGARPANRLILQGRDTHYHLELPLDFTDTREQRGLPVDTYKVSTNISGLDAWRQTVLLPGSIAPPTYYTRSPAYELEITRAKPVRPPSLTIKTRLALAGRLDVLSRPPDRLATDLFADREVGKILDLLLYEQEQQPELRQLLVQRLEVIDLLVLDPRDMAQLRRSPELAAIIEDYVKKGGALFAFVSETGDYGQVVGAPLTIGSLSKPTGRFGLAPGEVAGVVPWVDRKVDVRSKRALPELSRLPQGAWRVIAFTQGRANPRIVERGQRKDGGYVALWFDDPGSFRDRLRGTVPKVEETRGKMEEHILRWAKYLMYRRYDKTGKLRRQAEEGLGW